MPLKKEQELHELKSRFVAMASHEFRNPLSAILTSGIFIGQENEPGKEGKRQNLGVQLQHCYYPVVILKTFSLKHLKKDSCSTPKGLT